MEFCVVELVVHENWHLNKLKWCLLHNLNYNCYPDLIPIGFVSSCFGYVWFNWKFKHMDSRVVVHENWPLNKLNGVCYIHRTIIVNQTWFHLDLFPAVFDTSDLTGKWKIWSSWTLKWWSLPSINYNVYSDLIRLEFVIIVTWFLSCEDIGKYVFILSNYLD